MSRLGKRAVLSAIAVVSMFGVASEASGAELSIKVSKSEVTVPNTDVKVSVALDTEGAGSPGGYEVKLYESRFPFKSQRLIDRQMLPGTGNVTFPVNVEYNSRYQAVVDDNSFSVVSDKKPVYVNPLLNQGGKVTRNRSFRASFSVRYSPELPVKLAGSKVSFYFRKVGSKTFVRQDRATSHQAGKGKIVARGSFGLPNGNYRFYTLGCVTFPKKPLGLFGPNYRYFKCPKKLPASSGRAAARVQPAAFSNLSASAFIP